MHLKNYSKKIFSIIAILLTIGQIILCSNTYVKADEEGTYENPVSTENGDGVEMPVHSYGDAIETQDIDVDEEIDSDDEYEIDECIDYDDCPPSFYLNSIVGGKAALKLSGIPEALYSSYVYFFQNPSGEYVRVDLDYTNPTRIYTISGGELKSQKEINVELSKSIAFFNGKDNYFILYGDSNPNESDKKEVFRLVKYSKNWNRIGACSIFGSNTADAGNTASMDEVGDRIYIHTCHTMYKTEDGYNHQANMTLDISKSKMKINSSYYGIAGLGYGYVSHSFQQIIKVDGGNVYRIDRGDAYPRGLAYTKINVGDKIGNVCDDFDTLLEYKGEFGDNNTYSEISGLEYSEKYILTCGNYANNSKDIDTRNVYVTSMNKDTGNVEVQYLTNYSDEILNQKEEVYVRCNNVYLVKYSENAFVIMWNEQKEKCINDNNWIRWERGEQLLKYVFLDQAGRMISDIYSINNNIIDAQPIIDVDGYICWSSTNEVETTICYLNPYTKKVYLTPPSIIYRTHVQSIGWQGNVADGVMAGTSGKSKRLEGIEIKVQGCENLGIQYTTHCQTYGWLPWSSNGDMNGTEGEAKRLEAIKIKITGSANKNYDVYYRVHAQTYGWMGWAKNGEPAGTAGLSKRLEGIQIIILPKGSSGPGNIGGIKSSNKAYIYDSKNGNKSPVLGGTVTTISNPDVPGNSITNISYRAHIQSIGWQGWKYNGDMSGTSGQAKGLEGIEIRLTNKQYNGGITYRTHIQSLGWENTWKADGAISGTVGKAKRLEAVQINLHGEMAEHYDVYYRVHVQNYGWLGWAKNGQNAGTAGYAKRIEGIQIVLVEKGKPAPGKTYNGITANRNESYISK